MLVSERRATPSTDGIDVAHVSRCSSNDYTDWWSWSPEPAVGAGDSGYASGQFVNYKYFGSCFEITREDPWANVEGRRPVQARRRQHQHLQPGLDPHHLRRRRRLAHRRPAGQERHAVHQGQQPQQRCLSRLETTRSDDMGTWSPDYPALADCNGTPQQRFTVIGYTPRLLHQPTSSRTTSAAAWLRTGLPPRPGFDYPDVIAAPAPAAPSSAGTPRPTSCRATSTTSSRRR